MKLLFDENLPPRLVRSKDSDFVECALLEGAPAKVIRLRLGNCSTARLEALLRDYSPVIHTFNDNPDETVLFLP